MDYHASRLIQVKSKGNKWYVQVTKPRELQSPKSKQEKRSTGTTDRKAAEKRQHQITQEIYARFDQMLGVNRPTSQSNFTIKYIDDHPDPFAMYRPWPAFDPDDPNKRLSVLRPIYIDQRRWNREKSKVGADQHIKEFTTVVGNFPVDKLKKKHAYDYAQYLDDVGRANSTIKTRVSSVANLLKWCEQRGHLEISPFLNLSLSNYGFPSKRYKPLTVSELKKLFQQDMPDKDRLCLSILATTGMRLDEVALLTWEQVKEEAGIRYLDLIDATVKNEGSNRKVPIHSAIQLPERGVGRLFDYRLGQDGKAQGDASKSLMPFVRNAIGDDPRKVVHSLRGSFKDMMRNSGTSKELNDFITGHSSGDAAGNYGEGHALILRHLAVETLDASFLHKS